MISKFKIVVTLITTLLLLTVLGKINNTPTHAESANSTNDIITNSKIITYHDLKIDTALAETKYDQYSNIREISICNINKPTNYYFIDSAQWISDLYYYMITELHFFDIPFNYIIDDSNIYQTRTNNPIDLQPITTESGNRIVVGIVDFDTNKNENVKTFLEELSGFYDISAENVKIVECSSKRNDTNDNFISYLEITSTNQNILDFFETFGPYKTNSKIYNAELISVEYSKEAEPFKELEITATLKNTGNSPWYKNSGITLVTNNELLKNSDFYLSKTWMSRSHVAQIEEIVPVGEEYRLKFYLLPYPTPTDGKEDFVIIDPSGKPIAETEFTVSFKTKDLGYIFVRVKPNAYGFLNVRVQPLRDAEVITKVEPSAVFQVLEESNGWTKIKIDDQKEGWVVSTYVETVQ
ncbi:MAG TPA: SH3 domain-containing protein [Candidatus Dojkabacteria bacterium]|nr:SH3 domain-containing protein [Candidatus Dojkabacteria bacterium]HQF36184.1 SH3 domain-containing protein [Candidatus Dojkabacteria bacterium]